MPLGIKSYLEGAYWLYHSINATNKIKQGVINQTEDLCTR